MGLALPKPKLLIWDYDGTLAPTLDQIVTSFQAAFVYGLDQTVDAATIVSWFGPTDEAVIREHVPPERFVGALRRFYESYRALEARASMFPTLRAFMERTHDTVQHAVVTNKGRLTTEIALRAQGLHSLLAMTVTGDDVLRPKPDPMGIHRVLDRLAVAPDETVFFGDSPTDIEAAHAAGVRVVAVGYGGIHARAYLESHRPTWLLDDPASVPGWYEQWA